jgi:hypothetical protein
MSRPVTAKSTSYAASGRFSNRVERFPTAPPGNRGTINRGFENGMTRFRLAVLVLIGAAFLAAPLSALCSSCCVPESGLSGPMPCCDGTCGPSWTAARPADPVVASPKIRVDSPLSTEALQSPVIGRTIVTGLLTAALPTLATESPPASASVLRL